MRTRLKLVLMFALWTAAFGPAAAAPAYADYARAGLVYPYEDSRVLYRGVDDFERVKTPQPGDLAVWLGHVGIVLSPEDKTFLSSVRSGIITESWAAPHWARRGRPHFFRYRIGPYANLTLLAAIMSDGPAVQSPAVRNPAVQNPAVQNEATRAAGIHIPATPND